MNASRDYAFEALAEVSGTDWTTGRGELNIALKTIRAESEVEDSYILADLIHARAKMYREVMPDVMLTPTALAKHWRRVLEESERKSRPVHAPNQAVAATECATCGGDRFVLVGARPVVQSQWAREHGIEPNKNESFEEYSACPDCAETNTSFWRADGSRSRALDPAQVRERMVQ